MGLSAKGVYSTLGDYNAFAFAGDAGAAAWFETPHIGQRPKPPTLKQLEAEFEKDQKGIEAEKAKKTAEATRKSAQVQKEIAGLEKTSGDLSAQLQKADEAKLPALQAKKDENEGGPRAEAPGAGCGPGRGASRRGGDPAVVRGRGRRGPGPLRRQGAEPGLDPAGAAAAVRGDRRPGAGAHGGNARMPTWTPASPGPGSCWRRRPRRCRRATKPTTSGGARASRAPARPSPATRRRSRPRSGRAVPSFPARSRA